jgi:integrase
MASRRPVSRLKFTPDRIAKLPRPAKGRIYYRDTITPGLAVLVTTAGPVAYYLSRKVDGRHVRYRLGGIDELPLSDARKLAAEKINAQARGVDIQAERAAKRGEITLGELFAYYLERHAKPHKKTWADDEKQFNRYLDSWKNHKLSSIHRADVQALHTRLGDKHGPYAANRLRSLLHTLFAKAALDFGFEKPNPVQGVKKFREHTRERFIQVDELPKFWAALEAEPSEVCRDFFKVALLTGARRSNVLEMSWAHVHLDRGTWTIPDTKSGDQMTVALVPAVVDVLRGRLGSNPAGTPWVFPGHVRGQHLKDPTKNWHAILERAGLSDLRIHDLRRTLGSWQAAGGSSLQIIGKSLGHKLASTTAIYSRLNLDPVRESVGRATDAILAAATPKPPKKPRARKGANNGKA